MKTVLLRSCLFFLGVFIYLSYGQTILEVPPDSIQHWIIDNRNADKDIIWLDIRDDNEVAQGIIASEHCRPYHVSWNFDWEAKVGDLPKNISIIIYCRSGARAKSAAKALIDGGFNANMVAIMQGGINAYTGKKTTDSLLLKPWSELPQPSYSKSSTVSRRNMPRSRAPGAPVSTLRKQLFNLKGQTLHRSIVNPHAPVFILEQIGDTRTTRIEGIHRLVQDE